MVSIIENVFIQLSEDYILNKNEAENIIDKLKDKLTGSLLKDMFASSNRDEFAKNILEPLVEEEVKTRKRIQIPTDLQLVKGLREILEDLSDDICME